MWDDHVVERLADIDPSFTDQMALLGKLSLIISKGNIALLFVLFQNLCFYCLFPATCQVGDFSNWQGFGET